MKEMSLNFLKIICFKINVFDKENGIKQSLKFKVQSLKFKVKTRLVLSFPLFHDNSYGSQFFVLPPALGSFPIFDTV